jgi:formate dehydrogenase subunit gamma
MIRSRTRMLLAIAGVVVLAAGTGIAITGLPVAGLPWAHAQAPAAQPGHEESDAIPRADMWRAVRRGATGHVSIPDHKAATLVQAQGERFREFRNGPLSSWGGWLLLAAVVAAAAFFAIRGQIKVEGGLSGRTIDRFNVIDRFTHWLTAIAFLLLALTGLNMLYGRHVLLPVVGLTAFSWITAIGKYIHNYIAFAFIAGLAIMFVLWVRNNIPRRADFQWLAMAGGLLKKGVHPPAYKFNAGQKIVFWVVILGGFSLSFSGICLLLPFEFHPFAPTFKALNIFGFGLPTTLTALQETQLALVWHGMVALVMIAVILGHIYIGTIGMQGALEAMVSGKVDENWALEHHALWVSQAKAAQQAQPAGGGS